MIKMYIYIKVPFLEHKKENAIKWPNTTKKLTFSIKLKYSLF